MNKQGYVNKSYSALEYIALADSAYITFAQTVQAVRLRKL
jgi:hypothetical protein